MEEFFDEFKKIQEVFSIHSSRLKSFSCQRGVICQQPKAWLPDEFFTNAKEKYNDDQNIQLLLIVSKFLSNLSSSSTLLGRLSTLEIGFLLLTKELVDETSVLTLHEANMPYLETIINYLVHLGPLSKSSDKLAELQTKLALTACLFRSDSDYQSDNTKNSPIKEKYYMAFVAFVLLASAEKADIEISDQIKLRTYIEHLYQSNKQMANSERPSWMIVLLHTLFIEQRLDEILENYTRTI